MVRRVWKDRIVENPRTFTFQNNGDGTTTLVPAPGQIVENGTPVNAAMLNGIERDIGILMDEYTKAKSGISVDGIYPIIEWKRSNGTLYKRSSLSGGTAPLWSTRTLAFYKEDGITIEVTFTFTLTYDADGNIISEVLVL